jgi:diacylglycerol kinase (ATP)
MEKVKNNFVKGRVRSIRYAVSGALLLLKTEHAIITQFSIGILFIILGFVVGINKTEWMIQIICFGFVLATEGLNTTIEKICDYIQPEYHKQIGLIKDISAGAVTFAALTAIVIILIIYIPYLF